MVTHNDGLVGIDAFIILIIQGMFVGVHHEDVPTQQAVVAETDFLGADNGAFRCHVEICTQFQVSAHRNLRAMPDASLATEADRAAHLPNATRTLAVVMPHIAEANFYHCPFHLFGEFHFAVQFAQISAVRHHHGQLQSRFQRKIMQVEAQRLRNRAEDVEEIESGHGYRIDWAKIEILNINTHEFATNFSKIITWKFVNHFWQFVLLKMQIFV